MKKKITSTGKRGFGVHLFLMTLLLTLSFSGMAQNRINSAKNQKPVVTKTNKQTQEPIHSKVDFSVLDFKKDEIFGAFNPNQELVDKRDQFGKHFQNQDGTTSAILTAGGSLHFLENGKWKAIDRQITANNTNRHSQHGYVNEKNSFLSFYPNYASAGIITEYREGNVVEGINKKMIWLDENYNPINQANINSSVAQISENKITYSNVFSGIDLVYYQQNDGRKMDYVINNSNALANIPSQAKYLAFAEDFSLPKGAKIDEDKNEEGNVIALNVSVNGTIVFRYDMPKHSDSNNKEITSYYKINQNTLYTIVSTEWLNSGLTYPIYIDPTVTVYPTAAGNYNTGAITASVFVKTVNNDMYVGMRYPYGATSGTRRFMRAWSSFNVTSIPAGSTISNVIFGCYIGLNSFDANYGEMARVVPITSGIPNTATGATLYNMCGENVPSALFSIGAGGTGNQSLNITSVVTSFLTNSLASGIFSLGFAPVGDFSTSYTEQVGIYGSNRLQETSNGKPYLTVIYTSSTPCSGTPTGGITGLNNPLGATSSIIAASVTGDTTGVSGLSYQWESATSASGPWTNISGATLATANITASNTTTTIYYRRKITCSGASNYSSVVSYSTSCRPSHLEGNCAGVGDCQYLGISNVTLGTINNTTGYANVSPAYNNYSGLQSTTLNDITTYTLSVTFKDLYNNGNVAAWIDWAGDGSFSGPNDFLGVRNNVSHNQVLTFTINVPAGATAGLKTLRVRSNYVDENFISTDACTVKDYGETEDYAVNVTVSEMVCSTVSGLNAVIGTPANGTNHALNVSWTGLTGATSYDIEFSMDNGVNYYNVGTGNTTSTSAIFNAADMPNAPFLFRVRAKNASQTCDWTTIGPVYTAADVPNLVVLANPTGTTMQISLQAETPVANPAITTYSLFNETLGLYVQADGSLGATEVFQTKATWGTTNVTGLTAETEYCFYAKAKNEDGDVRFTPAPTLLNTETFESFSSLTTFVSSAPSNVWATPASPTGGTPITLSTTAGCNGSKAIGMNNTSTSSVGSFVLSPTVNLSAFNQVTVTLDLTNSYNASYSSTSAFKFYIYGPNSSSAHATSVKIGSTTYTPQGINKYFYLFDIARSCQKVIVTFDITSLQDKANARINIEVGKNSTASFPFSFYLDNVTILENSGASSGSTCLSTTEDCPLLITSTTDATGCGSVILNAVGNAGTDQYKWYDAATGGNLVATTLSGDYQTPVLTETTTYYVTAFNDDCESPRVAVTATIVPTEAEITFSEGAESCTVGAVTMYAETNDDAIYEVRWYDALTGGTLVHTGFSYTVTVLEDTSFYVVAAEGDCESSLEREEVTIIMNAKTWNGSVSKNWSVAANWTPAGVPTATNCVVIPNTTNTPEILLGTNGFAKTLTLLEGSTMLVKSGASITVADNVTLSEDNGTTTANLTIENNANLVQTANVSSNNNVGKITVKRNSTPMFRLEATGWASPVENQKLYGFAIGTVNGRIYEYDEVANAFSNTNITQSSDFVPAKGYSVRAPNNYPTYTAVGTPTPVTFNGTFYGRPSNGDVGINLSYTNGKGNNYVGNPYPSPINADDLMDGNSQVNSLYFWTHEAPPIGGAYVSNNYATYSLGGGVPAAAGGLTPDGIIQVGQGFVAKVTASGLLQFTNNLRVNSSNGQFFKQATAAVERHRMWLNLSNSEVAFNQILIGYMSNATMGIDPQIDASLFDYTGSSIYSMIEDGPYVIQGRSLPFDVNDEVALGFKAAQAGTFTIDIDHVDGLFLQGQQIYIIDQLANTIHNLSDGAYNFVSEQGTFNTRFRIVYSEDAFLGVSNPEITNSDWIVYKNDDKIHVQTNGFEIDNISIYDLTGRLLIQEDNVNSATFSCNAYFAEQVLLVKVNKTLVKKVL